MSGQSVFNALELRTSVWDDQMFDILSGKKKNTSNLKADESLLGMDLLLPHRSDFPTLVNSSDANQYVFTWIHGIIFWKVESRRKSIFAQEGGDGKKTTFLSDVIVFGLGKQFPKWKVSFLLAAGLKQRHFDRDETSSLPFTSRAAVTPQTAALVPESTSLLRTQGKTTSQWQLR